MNLLIKNVHGPLSDVNVACDGSMFIVFLSRTAIQKDDVTHIFGVELMCIRIQWITEPIIYGFNQVPSLDVYEPDKLLDPFFMGLTMFWAQTCVDLARCVKSIFFGLNQALNPDMCEFSEMSNLFFWT